MYDKSNNGCFQSQLSPTGYIDIVVEITQICHPGKFSRLYFADSGQTAGKNVCYQENLDPAFNLPALSLSS